MAIIITIMTTRFEGQRNSKGSEDNHGPDVVVGEFTGAGRTLRERAYNSTIQIFETEVRAFSHYYVPLGKSLSVVRLGGNVEIGSWMLMVLRCSSQRLLSLVLSSLPSEEVDPELAVREMRAANTGKSSSNPKAADRSSGDIAVNHCRTSSWKFFVEADVVSVGSSVPFIFSLMFLVPLDSLTLNCKLSGL